MMGGNQRFGLSAQSTLQLPLGRSVGSAAKTAASGGLEEA
jgi:hypothetical protein